MNLRIIYDDKWRKGAIYDKSAEHPAHPATDSQTATQEMYWRHPNRSNGHPTMYASNDLGASHEVDFMAIRSHNFDPDAVITLYGDDNPAFPDPESRVIPHNAEDIFAFFNAFEKRYVKLEAANPDNPADYLKQATIFLAKAFAPNRNTGSGYAEGSEDLSEEDYSDSLVLFAQEKPIIDVGRYPFRGLDDATREEIKNKFFKEVGTHKAFIICFDKDNPNAASKFVKNAELISPVFEGAIRPGVNVWSWELSVREFR